MKRIHLTLLAAALALILTIGGIACDDEEAADEIQTPAEIETIMETETPIEQGILPVFYVGDVVTYETTLQDQPVKLSMEIVDETVHDGEDCYVVELTFEPPELEDITIIRAAGKYSKATILPVITEIEGKSGEMDISLIEETSYEFSGPLWPLKIGNEVEIATTVINTTVMGGTTSQTIEKVTTSKVEAVEEMTVTAGVFECFKVSEYNSDGVIKRTKWHSDEIKTNAKEMDYETGVSKELISFSVQ